MTTLLAVYNSDRCVGRCDANCYEARTMHCSCICGGRNHSAGLARASENVRAGVGLQREDLDRFVATRCGHGPADEPLARMIADKLVAIDRLDIPDARRARVFAWFRLNQLELPFDARADV